MSQKLKIFVFSITLIGLLFVFIVLPFANAGLTPPEPSVQSPTATGYAYLPFIEKVATNFATGLARQSDQSFVTYGFLSLGGVLGCVSVLLPFTGDNSSDQDEA